MDAYVAPPPVDSVARKKRPYVKRSTTPKIPNFVLRTAGIVNDATIRHIVEWNEAGNGLVIHNVRAQ